MAAVNHFTGLIFKLAFYRQKFYQVSISYFPKLNLTYGLVLARNPSDVMQPLLALLESFEGNPDLSTHPLILPIAAVEREIDRTSRRIHRWDKDVNDLEEVMGQHEYEGRPVGNPLEMDFTSKTRRLNYLSKRVGVDILHSGYVKFSLEIIEAWKKGLIGGRSEYLSMNGERICQGTTEKITLMQEDCRSLLLLAEYEEKRMRVLIQAVCSPVAPEDNGIHGKTN